jgi:hypothetical protein
MQCLEPNLIIVYDRDVDAFCSAKLDEAGATTAVSWPTLNIPATRRLRDHLSAFTFQDRSRKPLQHGRIYAMQTGSAFFT